MSTTKKKIILDKWSTAPNPKIQLIPIEGKKYSFLSLGAKGDGVIFSKESEKRIYFALDVDATYPEVDAYIFTVVDLRKSKAYLVGWHWVSEIKKIAKTVTREGKKMFMFPAVKLHSMIEIQAALDIAIN